MYFRNVTQRNLRTQDSRVIPVKIGGKKENERKTPRVPIELDRAEIEQG